MKLATMEILAKGRERVAQQESRDEAGMQAGVSGASSWAIGSVGKAPTSPSSGSAGV